MFTFLPVRVIKKTEVSTPVLKKVLEVEASGNTVRYGVLTCFLKVPKASET